MNSIEENRRFLAKILVLAAIPSQIAEIADSGLILEIQKIVSDLERLSPDFHLPARSTKARG